MKIIIILFLIFSSVFNTFSQLNTKILKGQYGDSTITFHQNGKVSTIDFRMDSNHIINRVIVYNSEGKEIYSGEHGRQYGTKGIDLKFYPNGQVSSIRQTMQPDGGIQFDDHTYYYDENGLFKYEQDNSLPPKIEAPTQTPYKKQIVIETSQAPNVKSTTLKLKNLTNCKISLIIRSKISRKDTLLSIKKLQQLEIGAYTDYTKSFTPDDYYELIFIPKKKRNKKTSYFKILKDTNLDLPEVKFWFIIDDF